MSETALQLLFVRLTLQIVEAYATCREVQSDEALRRLMEVVYSALVGASQAAKEVTSSAQPARPLPRGVFQDHILCFEDGRKLKLLKRHLLITYNLTPEQYRRKWDLPADYPMIAPAYAAERSALAIKHGLGRNTGSMRRSKRTNRSGSS